jgi:tRNA(His) guanylyltransferase
MKRLTNHQTRVVRRLIGTSGHPMRPEGDGGSAASHARDRGGRMAHSADVGGTGGVSSGAAGRRAMTDAIGDRMKRYEAATRTCLPPRTYTIIRVDGKAFHTFTRGMEKPYSQFLMDAMDASAQALCKQAMGCRLAYGQSDEYSFLLTDFERHESEPWFGGGVQKIASIAASIFTAHFNQAFAPYPHIAVFDARVFTVPSRPEVENYFIWRQHDAERNSLNMLASCHYSHKQLHGQNGSDRHEMLHAVGINWSNYPADFKRGRVIRKTESERKVSWTHKKTGVVTTQPIAESLWTVDSNIPVFTRDRGYLAVLIPEVNA